MLDGRYETGLTDGAWELIKPLLPAARYGGRPRTADVRAVVNAIFYLLRTGCQWRLLPHQFPPWGTVYYYFRYWRALESGCDCTAPFTSRRVWQPAGHRVRVWSSRTVNPLKTTERGGTRGFDGHKRVKGRKRHILVDTLGLPVANRVEPVSGVNYFFGSEILIVAEQASEYV